MHSRSATHLSSQDTLGTGKNVLIRGVSSFQGTNIVFGRAAKVSCVSSFRVFVRTVSLCFVHRSCEISVPCSLARYMYRPVVVSIATCTLVFLHGVS